MTRLSKITAIGHAPSSRGFSIPFARKVLGAGLAGAFALLAAGQADPAAAQGRNYRVESDRPTYRDQAQTVQSNQQLSRRQRICQHFERKLAANWVQGRQPSYELPGLQEKIEKLDGQYNLLQVKAKRGKCYTSFLIFGKQLRNTRFCHKVDRQLKIVEKRLERLNAKREAIIRPQNDQGQRAQIIQKLAQYKCGAQYQREAKKYSFFWWGDDEVYDNNDGRNGYGGEVSPYATYRTMCVRLCDGYYFPVSFSTLPSGFQQDEIICQQKCAAPAQLFVYRNPGEEVEQMTSWSGSVPYETLENAFRYRKEFVKGCSCKPSEYMVQRDYDSESNDVKAMEKSETAPVNDSKAAIGGQVSSAPAVTASTKMKTSELSKSGGSAP